MCGIVAYTGPGNAVSAVLRGLAKLEYRGYDSAGFAALEDGRLETLRVVGRVEELRRQAGKRDWRAHLAAGHTRWATHGAPTVQNAHPHCDTAGRIAVVHNGILENHSALRRELAEQGCRFLSQTDTEVAAHLISSLYEGNLLQAVARAIERLEGTFAFCVISSLHPGLLVGARRGSPLAVGVGDPAMLLASDALPILEHTRKVVYLEDDQVAALEPRKLLVTQRGRPQRPKPQTIRWSAEEAERGGFKHYMLKEIHEQPGALRKLAAKLIAGPGSDSDPRPVLRFEDLRTEEEQLRSVSRIVAVAQGTAYHAALVGRNMIERCARLPVQVEYGSDFRYRDPVLDPSVLVLAVSQSGETADTLGAVRLARERGCRVLSVVNVQGSSIARESDGVIYMHVGPEIGVASTKAFTGQLAALYALAIHLGMARNALAPGEARRRVEDLLQAPHSVEAALAQSASIEKIALKYQNASNALYLGRGTGYPLALEGALKLKEVSYVHAEGYDAAEMKHGPIALIDEKMPCFFLALQGRRYEKILANIQEVKARRGRVIALASHDDQRVAEYADDVIHVRDDRGIMNSAACAVPLQLIAYYIAVARGCDVDKPRNLAKSVTVE